MVFVSQERRTVVSQLKEAALPASQRPLLLRGNITKMVKRIRFK